jgi:hypothetical protein
LQFAGAFLAAALLIIAPLTIRNWLVFQHFIPVSLGAGQTMLEGISDYDPVRRFGIPNTDMGIMKMEAKEHDRPDYASTLFAPDGIQRDRLRIARAFDIIRRNPGWFLGVMVQRAASMLRLERARRISPVPPVSNQFAALNEAQRIWRATPEQLIAPTTDRFGAEFEMASDGQTVQIKWNDGKYAMQLKTPAVAIKQNHDYLLRLPAVVSAGRMAITVFGAGNSDEYASGIIGKAEVGEGQPQPKQSLELPFVSGSDEFIRVTFSYAATESERSVVSLGAAEIFELGPAAFLWTRYPRLFVNGLQRLFITAIMLPFALAGIVILIRRHAMKTLVLLLSVPAYYFCFQSLLHTEYRYVLAVHYFWFILVGVAIYEVWRLAFRLVRARVIHRRV